MTTDDKIKILFWLPQLGLGGTEKTCLLFGEYLSDEFEPFLCYPGDCGHKHRLEEFRSTFGADHVIPITNLQDIIDEHKIDIVHSFRSGYSEFPEPGKDFEGPHFVETNVFGQFDFNPLVKRSLFMSEWLLDKTRKQISILRVHVPEERWGFVNNPVVGPQHSENMRASIGIGDDTVVLGRCGRPDCGIYDDVNVKAGVMLVSQGYDIHFL
jgi:hypothetical protein